MKRRCIFFIFILFSVLICLNVNASELSEDDIFEEVYYNFDSESSHIMYKFSVMDKDNHIYVFRPGSSYKRICQEDVYYPDTAGVDGDVYDLITLTNGKKKTIELTGVLRSKTAKIVSYKEWDAPKAKPVISNEKATCLIEGKDMLSYYSNFSSSVGGEDYSYTVYKEDNKNVFTASSSEANAPAMEAAVFLWQLVVSDQGKETVCTFIMGDFIDYLSYEKEGKWNKNKGAADWSSFIENITLYDGTDGSCNLLPDQYQYGKNLNWQSGDLIYGMKADQSSLLPEEQITIPSSVKSIRLSYDDFLPEPYSALYTQMPGNHINPEIIDPVQQIHDYYYYRNKTHLVSINGENWFDIKAGQISPELPLQKGINLVYIVDSDLNRYSREFIGIDDARGILSHLLILFWDGEEEYTVNLNQSTKLKDLQIYRAGLDESDSLDCFSLYDIITEYKEGQEVKTISMNSAYPYLWINPITEAAEASVTVEDSRQFLGGFFLRCDSGKDYFDIKVVSENGDFSDNYRIYINWTLNAPELKSLSVTAGGTLETAFTPEIRDYYCEENSLGKISLSYTTSENVTTKIYVDRVYKETIEGMQQKNLLINLNVHEVRWNIESPIGKTAVYTMYFGRGTEKGLSEQAKLRAKKMVEKLSLGGYISYLKDYKGDGYWKTFGAASLGEEYLKGMLGYDVTKHEFKQSSDYSAVILELIMSGENPYDYLGTNYVEKLWEYNNNGDFGPFSCNIWALTALQAAGHSIPDKLVEKVKMMALSRGTDLDVRGWALYALSLYRASFTEKEYAQCIQSIKNVQIFSPISVNGVDVTGCFENFWYTNRNANSHACVVSGLVGMGIDITASEFCGENGADPINVLENYQAENGGWIYTPNNPAVNGSYNKDVIVAVGDIYKGSNVYTRYYLTEDRYNQLVSKAGQMLEDSSLAFAKKEALQKAYDEASKYVSSGSTISTHGEAYYALQDAMIAVDESISPGVFLGTAEEREQVNEVKQDIERISSYSYEDKKDLDQIKEKYDAIKEERLYHYIRNSDVLDKAYSYIKDIDDFLGSVDKIGSVNLTKTTKIKKARKAYDALSERQKTEAVVKEGLKTLLDAEAAIIKMNKPDKVERAIRNLGSIITLDMQDDIQAVREAYDSLPNADKAKVGNVKDLERAEEKLSYLLVQEAAIDNAAIVTEKISSIGDVSRNSEEAIRQAREAYDTLETEEEKNLVSNYRILLDSETEYANLLNRENLGNALTGADYYINQIYNAFGDSDQLGEDNYSNVSVAVETARQFFELEKEKRSDFCEMVSGYPSYVDIRTMLMEYSFNPDQDVSLSNLEETLDSIGDITLDHEPVVRKAEMIVEVLRASDETFENLESYETRISSLKEEITMIRDNYPDICTLVTAVGSIGKVNQTFQDAYLEAADLYNNADDTLISRIPSCTIETITEAANKYGEIQEELKELDRVEKLIDKTRQISNLMDEELVVSARDAYDGSERKESIINYLTLVEAEREIASLKKTVEDAQIAAEVEDMIGLLNSGAEINSVEVALARVAYDALTDAQKELVSNYTDLELAEEKAGNIPGDTDPKDDPEGLTNPAKKVVYTISLIRNKKASKPYLIGKKTKYKLVLKADGKTLAASKVKWKSGKRSIAVVSKNVVTFKKKGTVKITAVFGGKKYSSTIKVKKASFKLKKKKITLKAGKKYQIKYIALPDGRVTYRSMNKKIALVTKKGVIKAKKKGITKIKVRMNGITQYIKVIIK